MSAVLEEGRLEFRHMLESDLDAVIEIERAGYALPWTPGIFRDCLRVGYGCRVLMRDDIIVGYGLVSMGAGEAHILNLCVAPQWRRNGYGRRILDHLVESVSGYNVATVLLEVRPSNVDAIRLYQQAGFSEVGIRRNYYPDAGGREDALILAREL